MKVVSTSFEGRIHTKSVEIDYDKIEIGNWIIKKFVPESMLNNDSIRSYVHEAGVYVRGLFNIGIRKNKELL